MNKLNVIIPSAKLVPESLQNLGKLPAVIYPVNQRIAFDYIYAQYSSIASRIKVMCFENSEDVIKKLSPYGEKVIIQTLTQLRDLGYTVYEGLKDEHGTVIIHFADTLVTENISSWRGDCFYFSEDYISSTWTFFRMNEDGAFTDIIDKKNQPSGMHSSEKLFVGVFKVTRPQIFRECLEHAFDYPDNNISTFYQALSEYNYLFPMEPVRIRDWFDIGHSDKYFSSRLEVSAREFNHITIDKTRGILHKTSDEKKKFIQEIKWYLKLPSELEYTHPRIFNYSIHYARPYVSMEYYAYHTVHELFLYGDLNIQQWRDIFCRIRSVCHDFMRYSLKGDKIRPSLESMYLNKTLERLDMLRASDKFSSFFSGSIRINGRKYESLDGVCSVLKERVPEMLYDLDSFNIIHGDLCFTNIMTDPNLSFIKLIDPRGSFGAYDIYGDPRYDLAKLLHSIEGKYDFIIKDMFTIDFELEQRSMSYEIFEGKHDFGILELYREIFEPELERVRLIEALLFLSMIPLHGESLKHQLAMLCRGIEILNKVIDITKEGE